MLLGAPRLCASRAAAAAQSEGDGDRLGGDMDESSLLDLLECSVCLERLDTTAKVLPCQHTFCRRCLESIVCSRHELRCPECRILVGCGVDELPANILLVRLLDGIRQRPRAGASPGSSPPARPGPGPGPGSGAASALAGAGGSAPGSPVLLPAATSANASLRELATSRSAPPAKSSPVYTLCVVCYGQVWRTHHISLSDTNMEPRIGLAASRHLCLLPRWLEILVQGPADPIMQALARAGVSQIQRRAAPSGCQDTSVVGRSLTRLSSACLRSARGGRASAAACSGAPGLAGAPRWAEDALRTPGGGERGPQSLPQPSPSKALHSCEGKEPGDLRFSEGDVMVLRHRVDERWYHGLLPASYVQGVRPLPQAPPQGKALYDFEMKDRDQDKDCLTFSKDEVLTVIRRVDDNWAEGMLGDKIGIFPLLYVELNAAAKQLMEMDRLGPASASGCLAVVPSDPGVGASVAPGPTSGSTGAVSAFQRRVDSKKNAKKRHSFTALSVTHKSTQAASHRRSMEISAPVLISSSDPRAAARIGDLVHLSRSAPTQDASAGCTPAAEQQGTAPKVQLPLNVYLALYAYKPQKSDELELRKGDTYRVLEKCRDGWFKGTALRTGLSGVFPGNYVTPVSRVPVGGAGPPRNNAVGGSPLAKGMATTLHPGGGSLSSPATALRPALPLTMAQAPAQHQAVSSALGSCLRHSVQPAASQARSAGPPAAHPAQAQGRPTAAVSPLRAQSLPAVGSPQHSPWPAIPLTSAASAVTPPNVSAVHLNGEAGAGPAGGRSAPSPTSAGGRPDERRSERPLIRVCPST
ncbi:E3 ubiquitin-protein ligase SH3RF3 isoform 4-T4 [Megaptera novaeangliae]